jgi:hypothetical protein
MSAKLTESSPGEVFAVVEPMADSRSVMVKAEVKSVRSFLGWRSNGGSEGGAGQRELSINSATFDATHSSDV